MLRPEGGTPNQFLDSEIGQRIDYPAHQESDLGMRSFQLRDILVESFAEAAIVLWANLFLIEHSLNIIRARPQYLALFGVERLGLLQLGLQMFELRS